MKPSERFALYRERIKMFDPKIHAFLDERWDLAVNEVALADRRHDAKVLLSSVDGHCVAVKANIGVEELPRHGGIAAYRDDRALKDAAVVKRLKEAGAIVLGTVNMHEGALGATTDNPFFGRTYNPWGEDTTPGGSSGGSGAAVAAGLCDFALGTDTMGSVRIPSAYCGVQGYKPSFDCVPTDGLMLLSPTLDHIGPHARSVRTLRDIGAVISGKALVQDDIDVANLRLGCWDGAGEVLLDQPVLDGLTFLKQSLTDRGAMLLDVTPPQYDYSVSRRAGLLVSEVEGYAVHREYLQGNPEGFSDSFRSLLEWGHRQTAEKQEAAYAHLRHVKAAAPAIFDQVDAILAPTAPQTAFAFGEETPTNQADFTAWANIVGLPAVTLFTGLSPQGLPLSAQVITPFGTDALALSIAEAIENICGQPPLPSGFAGELPGN